MEVVIRQPLLAIPVNLVRVPLTADRHAIVRRRWRGTAENGRKFIFDLDEPLVHGAVFSADETSFYVLLQEPERILEIPLTNAIAGARLGWLIGHHHFPAQIKGSTIRVADHVATRRLLAREHVSFRERKAVFQPFRPRPDS